MAWILRFYIIASPPLRVVDKAGMAIGMVPYHWAMVAGALMQVGAKTSMHVLSKTLTDRFLRRANKEFFRPRGLVVRLCKAPAMRYLIKMDTSSRMDQQSNNTMQFAKNVGRTVEDIALRLPLPILGRIVELVSRPVPTVDLYTSANSTFTERRLAELNGYVCPLNLANIPPAVPPAAWMNRASGLAVKLDTYKTNNAQVNADRARRMLAISEGCPVPEPIPRDGGMLGAGMELWNRRDERKERKVEKKGRPKASKLRAQVAKVDRIEYNSTEALLWIVVLNADEDSTIDGTEFADSKDDEQVVNQYEWQKELELEGNEGEGAYIKGEKESLPDYAQGSFSKTYH